VITYGQLCLSQTYIYNSPLEVIYRYSLPVGGCVNNLIIKKVSEMKKENRSKRITFRLSESDHAVLTEKMLSAGYKSDGAYIRDALISAETKHKTVLTLAVIEVQRELMNLASSINAEKPYDELMTQLKRASEVSLGGAK
jgi:hypothetical protein